MRRQLALGIGVLLLAGCPAGFTDLCDNGACDADGSVGDAGVDAPPGCDPGADPKDSPACVVDSFGVFVDAANGKDTNAGTKLAPVKTIGHALSIVGTKPRIYVCEGAYAEDVVLNASHDGVSMYGGWKCADWSYSGNKPVIGKTQNPFKIDSLTKAVTLEDLEVDATDGDTTNLSSIAMFVNGSANVALKRVKLSAGKGYAGATGTLSSYTYPSQSDLNGNSSLGVDGGAPKTHTCPAGDTSTGGGGGYGNGSDGQDGTPGASNKGTLTACSGANTGGGKGANGANGSDGPKLTATGQLAGGGWVPSKGTDGSHGSIGQGGGGGGGYGNTANNGGGGGGGCGGCGGAGGGGGGGGGGSVALAVISSTVVVNASTLVATTAGDGGAGVAGQPGESFAGFGGIPGLGSFPGCNGGAGGTGGNGGAGAGGAGGISVGVLWKGGAAPTVDSATNAQITVAAKGGAKGTGGNSPANDGIDGVAQAVLQAP